uniref:Exoribonuclease phosphorolytic domain-containing protein n=1 Tax=Meloidogyne incognita TaxID=6306 RepID=A0A914NQK8_MELIC
MLSEFGFRKDARLPKQIRNIIYQTGIYSNADGSAYIEQGGTKVLCAVYGPREGRIKSRIQEESAIVVCQYSQSTFSVPDRRNRPRGDRRGNTNSRLLERAFEAVIFVNLYPRSQIDIFFEVIEASFKGSMTIETIVQYYELFKKKFNAADGGNLAACVNAGSLALADAGIPMRGLASAVECGCVDGVSCTDTSSREQILFFRSDGGNLAACVNAGSLALADAGIPMRGLASAVECGCVDGVSCTDTSSREQSELIPRITIATVGGREEIILISLKNLVHRSHLTEFLKSAIDACAQIHSCLETAVFENVKTAHRL